jgi:hypothetical protein
MKVIIPEIDSKLKCSSIFSWLLVTSEKHLKEKWIVFTEVHMFLQEKCGQRNRWGNNLP